MLDSTVHFTIHILVRHPTCYRTSSGTRSLLWQRTLSRFDDPLQSALDRGPKALEFINSQLVRDYMYAKFSKSVPPWGARTPFDYNIHEKFYLYDAEDEYGGDLDDNSQRKCVEKTRDEHGDVKDEEGRESTQDEHGDDCNDIEESRNPSQEDCTDRLRNADGDPEQKEKDKDMNENNDKEADSRKKNEDIATSRETYKFISPNGDRDGVREEKGETDRKEEDTTQNRSIHNDARRADKKYCLRVECNDDVQGGRPNNTPFMDQENDRGTGNATNSKRGHENGGTRARQEGSKVNKYGEKSSYSNSLLRYW